MRKSTWSKTAVAAFLLTLGVTAASKAVQEETRWFYEDDPENPISGEPNCIQNNPQTCARLHFYDSETETKGEPVPGSGPSVERLGTRQ